LGKGEKLVRRMRVGKARGKATFFQVRPDSGRRGLW